jgi:GT2 family glycosyltransferase
LAASCITRRDNPNVVDSAGDAWLRVGTAFKRGQGESASDWERFEEVFGACGAAFMIRREVFEALSGFDEDFFLVFEDVDLSYRVRLAGHRCLYVPTARVRHTVSGTLGCLSATSVFHGQRNVEWVYLKNTPAWLLARTLPAHLLYVLAGAGYFLAKGRLSAFLRGKAAALAGVSRVLDKRRVVQRTRAVDAQALWSAMTSGWIGVKLRDKGVRGGAR